MYTNPIHQAIHDKVLKPQLDKLTWEANGKIMNVDYMKQRVDVWWVDKLGVSKMSKGVPISRQSNGVFTASPEHGQRVKLGFINGDSNYPYVSIFYAHDSKEDDFYAKGGSAIPKGIASSLWG